MSKKYDELGKNILELVGGEDNVQNVRHCITRLRFNLKDENKANTESIQKLDGVVTVVKSGGQYQVVIGEQVGEVYNSIIDNSSLGSGNSDSSSPENDNRNIFEKFVDFISGVFQPFLMVLAATGMIKGVVALLGAFGLTVDNSGLAYVLNAAGDGFFQFLPVMVAITTARKLRMNEFTALAIAVAFLHPQFSGLTDGNPLYTLFAGSAFESPVHLEFLGIPVIYPISGYYSAIIPIILSVWVGSKFENLFKRILPELVSSFLTPFFTVIFAFPISLILIGPIANWLSALVGVIFTGLMNWNSVIFAIVLAVSWQILVIFGLHWGIIPLMFITLAETGMDQIGPATMVSTFGILGALIALVVKSKNQRIRQIAIPSSLSALFGISEPAIYGLMLPMPRSFIYALIGNLVGGFWVGLTNVTAYRTGGLGIFSIFNTIGNDGTLGSNFWNQVIAFALATFVAFALQMVFPVPQLEDESRKDGNNNENIQDKEIETEGMVFADAAEELVGSPLSGEVLPLKETEDPVFASGAMGKGVTIIPDKGVVKSPVNGKVTTIFETGHAVGLTSEGGVEILIHIGIDTVKLEGKGFEKLVENEEIVVAGQELIRFDMNIIREAGLKVESPVIVTNTPDYTDVLVTQEKNVKVGDYLLTTIKKEKYNGLK